MTELHRPGTMTEPLSVPYRERERSVTMEPMGEEHDELLTINIGPHHPATHGVLRLLTTLEGEIVRDVKPIIGYVHTGIEKSCEDQQYWKVIPFVERMDYLAYYFNAMAFCRAVEQLLDEEVPQRAQWLRVIHLELNRIASHLFWIATGSLDIGAITMLWWGCRDRDLALDLFEMSGGQRFHTRYFQVGGVVEDIPPGFEAQTRKFIETMRTRIPQYLSLLDRNEIWLQRTKGTGIVPLETLLDSGYQNFDFKVPVGTVGDNYDRFRVRVEEMLESLKIIEQALDGLPEGPYITDNRKIALPPRHELATSMEALIHHFKLVTEGFRVPPGESYAAVESPRGELGCYVLADGSAKPARVHVRDPSFVNLQALPAMARDHLLADFIACVAMLDPILGGVDR
jgi:NADH-quinone oxidoreductase subunit D